MERAAARSRRRPQRRTISDRLAAEIVRSVRSLGGAATGQSFVARRKVVSAVTFFKYSSIAALLGALLLSAGSTLLLMRRIIRPLREAAAIADRIAEGELQAPIPAGGPDETGSAAALDDA